VNRAGFLAGGQTQKSAADTEEPGAAQDGRQRFNAGQPSAGRAGRKRPRKEDAAPGETGAASLRLHECRLDLAPGAEGIVKKLAALDPVDFSGHSLRDGRRGPPSRCTLDFGFGADPISRRLLCRPLARYGKSGVSLVSTTLDHLYPANQEASGGPAGP
jgi:hypothetical protein